MKYIKKKKLNNPFKKNKIKVLFIFNKFFFRLNNTYNVKDWSSNNKYIKIKSSNISTDNKHKKTMRYNPIVSLNIYQKTTKDIIKKKLM